MKDKKERDKKEVRALKQQIRRNMITKVKKDKTKYDRKNDSGLCLVRFY